MKPQVLAQVHDGRRTYRVVKYNSGLKRLQVLNNAYWNTVRDFDSVHFNPTNPAVNPLINALKESK